MAPMAFQLARAHGGSMCQRRLKNSMFRSHGAFCSEVDRAANTGGEMKRKCVVSNDCPPWRKFDCGEQNGLLRPVMPKRRVWAEHMEVRAITGKFVKDQAGKVARDDPRIGPQHRRQAF
ncbi:unnamed protein product [Symbiodinium sp. CCMP2456]|nr:unnamed protein product [Symbiodinium sp. CCMP2456]